MIFGSDKFYSATAIQHANQEAEKESIRLYAEHVASLAAGQTNTRSLIEECADAIFLSRSPAAEAQAEAVLAVIRRRGLLNLQGVELCRAELGPLSVAVIKENMG